MDFLEHGFIVLRPYPYLQAAIVITAFLILAKLSDLFLCRVVRRLVARSASNFDDQLIDILHRPVFMTIALFGLAMA